MRDGYHARRSFPPMAEGTAYQQQKQVLRIMASLSLSATPATPQEKRPRNTYTTQANQTRNSEQFTSTALRAVRKAPTGSERQSARSKPCACASPKGERTEGAQDRGDVCMMRQEINREPRQGRWRSGTVTATNWARWGRRLYEEDDGCVERAFSVVSSLFVPSPRVT